MLPTTANALIIRSEIALSIQIADFFHELVVLVVELYVSAFVADFLFVKLILGSLGDLLSVENDEGRPGSLAIEFLDEDA